VFAASRAARVFLDVQDQLGVPLLELDHVRLGNARHGVSAGAHSPAVDLVAAVHDGDVPDHRASFLCVNVQLFPQRAHGNFKILQDAVGFILGGEGLFTLG